VQWLKCKSVAGGSGRDAIGVKRKRDGEGVMGKGYTLPLPSDGVWESVVSSTAGCGAEPRPKKLVYFLCHGTQRKIQSDTNKPTILRIS